MLSNLIIKLKIVLSEHGDLPVYIFDEYDRAKGKNTLGGFILKTQEKKSYKRPKRIEFY